MSDETDKPLGRQRLEALTANKEAVASISEAVMADPRRREEFLADPAAFLEQAGVQLPGSVELTDRDRELVRIVTDQEIGEIYKGGDVEKLKDHLRENYPGMISESTMVADTVADFEVAVEALVIAVGVAFVPILVADKVSEVARVESVVNARLSEHEARLAALEKTLG